MTVTLSGSASGTVVTDGAGNYSFGSVTPGFTTVTISGFSTEYGFPSTSQGITIDPGEAGVVDFVGWIIRTASITGIVTVDGAGVPGIAVTAVGPEGTFNVLTAAGGNYAFGSLRAGEYTVSIDPPAGATFPFTSTVVTLTVDETATVNFVGSSLTGTLSGYVDYPGGALEGVTVTISGAGSGSTTTDASGFYTFPDVPVGSYTVAISDYPAYAQFSTTSKPGTVSEGGTTFVNFTGEYVFTSSISGSVTASGIPVEGATVTVLGEFNIDRVTDASGSYSVTGLREDYYTVWLHNIPAGFDFSVTTEDIFLATDEDAVVNFTGTVSTGTITGTVLVEGSGAAGVTVTLSGDASGSTTTAAGGVYSFPGLTPGSYTVTVSPPAGTVFPYTSQGVTLSAGETVIVDFASFTPPTLSGFTWEFLVLNDPDCGNSGSLHGFTFDYSDPDGDVPVSGGSFSGTPVRLEWAFLPAGHSGDMLMDPPPDATGDGYSGEGYFELCIAFQIAENTHFSAAVSLEDEQGLWSNTVSVTLPRPEGGNVPPPEFAPASTGVPVRGGNVEVVGAGREVRR